MRFIILFILTFTFLIQGQPVNGLPIASEVRVGENGISTRLVIAFSEKVEFELHLLEDPYRLVIDFPTIVWSPDKKTASIKLDSIKSIRFANFKNLTSRVVLDLRGPVEVKKAHISKPVNTSYYRFVLDFDSLVTESLKPFQQNKIYYQNFIL